MFSTLSRLILNPSTIEQVETYLHKLFGQRCLVIGETTTAALFAMAHEQTRLTGAAIAETSEVTVRRHILTRAQEAFVIGHEICHILLRSPGDMTQLWLEDTLDTIQTKQKTGYRASLRGLRAYREDFDRAVARRGIVVPTPGSLRYLRESLRWMRWRKRLMNTAELDEFSAQLTVGSPLVEECVCDTFGLIAAILNLSKTKADWTTAIEASVLALHNLRLIQSLDEEAAVSVAGRADRPPAESSVLAAQVRLSFLRREIRQAGHRIFPEFDADEAHACAVRTNQTYAAQIMDHVLFGYFVGREEGLRYSRDHPEEVDAIGFDEIPALRLLLGFYERGDRSETH
ncbi:hypothetical protein [Nocardia terpenica]|uniref:Uncharacterized protein n=1 Tax=Nocardia terpenica TaxID=455432 RepID=A0A6G9Z611_9NOCA|nr:hypothetical protein [Nocardia terpenica]QIS20958.1 hypothetical protein F6W96_24210 [Nocardia terpenica]